MSIARCFGLLLSFAGQTSTHKLQPVQSSGDTCSVYFCPEKFFHFASAVLKATGAFVNAVSFTTFARITACGHTITHLPHWMHSFSSHSGISSAILRFSHAAVPSGKVP